MENSKAQYWFDELKEIWLAKDISRVRTLLTENVEYYEDPFEKPLTSVSDIERAWQEVEGQEILELDITLLLELENKAVASYSFTYNDEQGSTHRSKGVYFVHLDSLGKAKEFRQWWTTQ